MTRHGEKLAAKGWVVRLEGGTYEVVEDKRIKLWMRQLVSEARGLHTLVDLFQDFELVAVSVVVSNVAKFKQRVASGYFDSLGEFVTAVELVKKKTGLLSVPLLNALTRLNETLDVE